MRSALILFSLLCFLLFASLSHAATHSHDNATVFSQSSRQGVYNLAQGTDDCPPTLQWQDLKQCPGGFRLQELHSPRPLTHSETFCHINRKSPTRIQRARGIEKFKVSYTVEADNSLLKKHQNIERSINGASYEVELQASLILAPDGSFMYDRSLGTKGWSCLYRK